MDRFPLPVLVLAIALGLAVSGAVALVLYRHRHKIETRLRGDEPDPRLSMWWSRQAALWILIPGGAAAFAVLWLYAQLS